MTNFIYPKRKFCPCRVMLAKENKLNKYKRQCAERTEYERWVLLYAFAGQIFECFFFLDNQFNKWNHRFDVNGPIRLFAVLTYSCSLKSNVYMHHITGYIRTHAHEIKNTLQFYISHAEVQLVECAVICCCCCWLISFVFFLRYTKLQLCSFYSCVWHHHGSISI